MTFEEIRQLIVVFATFMAGYGYAFYRYRLPQIEKENEEDDKRRIQTIEDARIGSHRSARESV